MHVPCCGLESLDGFNCVPALEELYAPFNSISCLEPLMDADQLHVLDLEGNNIVEPEQLQFLTVCQDLEIVCLLNNPVCSTHPDAWHDCISSRNRSHGLGETAERAGSKSANDTSTRQQQVVRHRFSPHFQSKPG